MYIWGSNTEGQCGLGQTPSIIAAPTLLTIKNSIITHVSCGYYHTAFVTGKTVKNIVLFVTELKYSSMR